MLTAADPPSGEAMAHANGIDICYQSMGDPGAPTILLIMGLGMQLISWPDAFCAGLVDSGFRVIRFDNRDAGHSTRIAWGQRPRLLLAIARGVVGLRVRSPYRLSDMADDALGLLDVLRVERAHLVGVSMGGMIAQCVAARHAQRLLSLTSVSYTHLDVYKRQECESPQTDNIEVQASHLGMGLNPLTLYAIADRLSQAEGDWRPFDRSGFRSYLYPDPRRQASF